MALVGRDAICARETTLPDNYPDEVPAPIRVLRIGDVGIGAVPCEVFAEIGLEIKITSRLKNAFTVELANGCLRTPARHALGG